MFDKLERKSRIINELMSYLGDMDSEKIKYPKGADLTGTGKEMFDNMKSEEFQGVPTSEINKVLDCSPEGKMEIEVVKEMPEQEDKEKSPYDDMSGEEIMSLMREYMRA